MHTSWIRPASPTASPTRPSTPPTVHGNSAFTNPPSSGSHRTSRLSPSVEKSTRRTSVPQDTSNRYKSRHHLKPSKPWDSCIRCPVMPSMISLPWTTTTPCTSRTDGRFSEFRPAPSTVAMPSATVTDVPRLLSRTHTHGTISYASLRNACVGYEGS